MVERIMAFDKNKDGKVTKDELPERMQELIARGDANKDGAFDKDEIKKLTADLAGAGPRRGFGAGGGFPPFGGFGPPVVIERALDDLNLSEKTKEKAEAVVREHQENIRKMVDLAQVELLLKMKEVLSAEEFKNFKAALDRQPGFGDQPFGRGGRPPGFAPAGQPPSRDLERRLDQLQRELDNLRREIRR
jgi:hypothetical protein